MKITIFTGVNPVNYEYFFYFIDNFRKMSSGQNELCFKVLTGPARGQITTVCNERQINSIASKNVDHFSNEFTVILNRTAVVVLDK